MRSWCKTLYLFDTLDKLARQKFFFVSPWTMFLKSIRQLGSIRRVHNFWWKHWSQIKLNPAHLFHEMQNTAGFIKNQCCHQQGDWAPNDFMSYVNNVLLEFYVSYRLLNLMLLADLGTLSLYATKERAKAKSYDDRALCYSKVSSHNWRLKLEKHRFCSELVSGAGPGFGTLLKGL